MEIEKYVCTLEQSFILDYLLPYRDSLYVWIKDTEKHAYIFSLEERRRLTTFGRHEGNRYHYKPAYTLQELYEIMAELHETKGYKIFNDWFFNHATNYDPKCVADFIIKKLEAINGQV